MEKNIIKNLEKYSSNVPFNNNWVEWFIGFMDGDGNFQITFSNPKGKISDLAPEDVIYVKYSINISLSIQDLDLIVDIQKNLNGMGIIYTYPDRNEARISFSKKEELIWLINNVFNKAPLITENQRSRYFRLKYGVLNNIKKFLCKNEANKFLITNFNEPNIPVNYYNSQNTAFYNWILGIINSEGNFYIRKIKNNNNTIENINQGLKKVFIFQIEHTDIFLLELIKKEFKFTPKIFHRAKRSITKKNTYSLFISSKSNIDSLIKFCNNYKLNGLLGYKKIQFDSWLKEYNS